MLKAYSETIQAAELRIRSCYFYESLVFFTRVVAFLFQICDVLVFCLHRLWVVPYPIFSALFLEIVSKTGGDQDDSAGRMKTKLRISF